MQFESAKTLTKTLRSKIITSDEVVDIVRSLDGVHPYFPKREVFVIDLILDRWNNFKNTDFRENPRVWKLFNDTWVKIGDENLQKSLFKKLKFPGLLQSSLETFNGIEDTAKVQEYVESVNTTCDLLIKSVTSLQLPYEANLSILAAATQICSRISYANRVEFLMNLINLTNFDSQLSKLTNKLSSIFSDILLLPILDYISNFESNIIDKDIILTFKGYIMSALFNADIIGLDTTNILHEFFDAKKSTISHNSAVIIFEIAMNSLSKNNFIQLESIYTMIVDVHDALKPDLLQKLSSTKKTMSHEFLFKLIKDSFQSLDKVTNPQEKIRDWSLIRSILKLDIEIAIELSNEILALLLKNYHSFEKECQQIWAEFIECHISAREFFGFFGRLRTYYDHDHNISKFLCAREYRLDINKRIGLLSSLHLKELISEYVADMVSTSRSKISAILLSIITEGLVHLNPSQLSEYRPYFQEVYMIDDINYAEQWAVKYFLMDVFDNIIPLDMLERYKNKDIQKVILESPTINLQTFMFFLKIREYISMDIKEIENALMKYLSINKSSTFAFLILKNWYTIISEEFDSQNIRNLLEMLCLNSNFSLLLEFMKDDDIFEEPNLIHKLIGYLSDNLTESAALDVLKIIPIQCYEKSSRVSLIDRLASLKINESVIDALSHLLIFPTFKTRLETDVGTFFELFKNSIDLNHHSEKLLTTIWYHHAHSNDSSSKDFTYNLVNLVVANLSKLIDVKVSFWLAYYIQIYDEKRVHSNLRKEYFKAISAYSDKQSNLMPWLLKTLYQLLIREADLSMYQDVIKDCIQKYKLDGSNSNELKISVFMIYTLKDDSDFSFILAHYLALRSQGCHAMELLTGVSEYLKLTAHYSSEKYNAALHLVCCALNDNTKTFHNYLLEIVPSLMLNLSKQNHIGQKLTVRLLSATYTSITQGMMDINSLTKFISTLKEILISKPWMFDQYTVELLLPLSLEICNSIIPTTDFSNVQLQNNRIFISLCRLLSTLFTVHRFKLNQRYHVIDSLLCGMMKYVINSQFYGLTEECAKAFARCVITFCEPTTNTSTKNKNQTTSKVNEIKKILRKHVPILLVNYTELVIGNSIDNEIRREIDPALYSMLNVISSSELQWISTLLGSTGRQYFKSIYAEYKRIGKWTEQ